MRFLAYADELSFKNGLTFMLLVANWLRTFGVRTKVFFQTDNGTEFGGLGASRKRQLMQQLIFDSLDVQLLSTPPRALLNSFVERSHRTDDEEFYAINLTSATSRSAFMKMAQAWSLYFNYRRPHFGKNMKGKTPVMALKKFHSMSSVAIGAMPVLNLDRLSLHLAELCDITTIPWNNSPKTQRAVKETMAPYQFLDWYRSVILPGLVNLTMSVHHIRQLHLDCYCVLIASSTYSSLPAQHNVILPVVTVKTSYKALSLYRNHPSEVHIPPHPRSAQFFFHQ